MKTATPKKSTLFKKGDKTNCTNYRGISLLAIDFMILETVMKNILEPLYCGRPNQAGFKSNKRCRDQIFAIRLPEKALNVLNAIYSETYSQVRVYSTMSRKFKLLSVFRQGSILSLFLFNLVIDWMMELALSNDLLGITLDDMIAVIYFADDICLKDDNGNDAQVFC